MRCKSLAAAPCCCANRRTYSSIDTHSSFLHIPSLSFFPSFCSFSSTFVSSILFPFYSTTMLLLFNSSLLLHLFCSFFPPSSPSSSSSSRYSIILRCWCEVAEKRPSFSELVTVITTSLEAIAGYIDFSYLSVVNKEGHPYDHLAEQDEGT